MSSARLGNLYKEYLDLGHGVQLAREYGMDGNTLTYESVRPVVHLADLLGSTVATFDAQGNTIADRYYGAFGDERQASGASAKAACWSEWLGVRLSSWEPTEPEAHSPLLPHNA